jgi:hypothetical protein
MNRRGQTIVHAWMVHADHFVNDVKTIGGSKFQFVVHCLIGIWSGAFDRVHEKCV